MEVMIALLDTLPWFNIGPSVLGSWTVSAPKTLLTSSICVQIAPARYYILYPLQFVNVLKWV